MKLLVTGGNGQLGQSFKEIIRQGNVEAEFIDIEELDLTDKTAVEAYFQNQKIDILINCAAYTAVDRAESEPEKAEAINVTAVENIATAAKNHNFKIIHISTDYVFDGEKKEGYVETDIPNPQSVYGKTKLKGEKTLSEKLPDAIIIRTAWLYSNYGRNFYLTMRGKALKGDKVGVVGDQTGSPTNAEDLASAIMEIILSGKWEAGTYHYSNGGKTTWYEFTREIYRMSAADPDLVSMISSSEYKSAARRPANSLLDKTKIIDTFGIEIPEWRESLRETIEKRGQTPEIREIKDGNK